MNPVEIMGFYFIGVMLACIVCGCSDEVAEWPDRFTADAKYTIYVGIVSFWPLALTIFMICLIGYILPRFLYRSVRLIGRGIRDIWRQHKMPRATLIVKDNPKKGGI